MGSAWCFALARAAFRQELEGLGFEEVSETEYSSASEQLKSIFNTATWVSNHQPSNVPIVLPVEYSLADLFKDAGIEPEGKLQFVVEHLEVVASIEATKADGPLFDDLAYRPIDLLIKDDSNAWAVVITHQDDLHVVKTSDPPVSPSGGKSEND